MILSIFRGQDISDNLVDAIIVDFRLVDDLGLELDRGFFEGGESGFKGVVLHVFINIVIFCSIGKYCLIGNI